MGGKSHEAKAKETMEVAGRSSRTSIHLLTNLLKVNRLSPHGLQFLATTAVLTRTRNRIGPSELQFLVATAVVTRKLNRLGPSWLQFLVTTAVVSRKRK